MVGSSSRSQSIYHHNPGIREFCCHQMRASLPSSLLWPIVLSSLAKQTFACIWNLIDQIQNQRKSGGLRGLPNGHNGCIWMVANDSAIFDSPLALPTTRLLVLRSRRTDQHFSGIQLCLIWIVKFRVWTAILVAHWVCWLHLFHLQSLRQFAMSQSILTHTHTRPWL